MGKRARGLQPPACSFPFLIAGMAKNGRLCFHFESVLNSYMLSDLQTQKDPRDQAAVNQPCVSVCVCVCVSACMFLLAGTVAKKAV